MASCVNIMVDIHCTYARICIASHLRNIK
jgi:hypothetical protein